MGASRDALEPERWEFGRYPIGHQFLAPPDHIRAQRECGVSGNPFSCELLLADGVWYSFSGNKVVAKAVRVPSAAMPGWIIPVERPNRCRARLERLTGYKVRIWTDDQGTTFVETVNQLIPQHGGAFAISVSFRHGRVVDIVETPLPHAHD